MQETKGHTAELRLMALYQTADRNSSLGRFVAHSARGQRRPPGRRGQARPGKMCEPAVLPPNQTGGNSRDGPIWVRTPPVARASRLSRFVGHTGSHESHSYFGGLAYPTRLHTQGRGGVQTSGGYGPRGPWMAPGVWDGPRVRRCPEIRRDSRVSLDTPKYKWLL